MCLNGADSACPILRRHGKYGRARSPGQGGLLPRLEKSPSVCQVLASSTGCQSSGSNRSILGVANGLLGEFLSKKLAGRSAHGGGQYCFS